MKKILWALGFSGLLFVGTSGVSAAENLITVKTFPDQTTVTVGMMFLVKVQVLNTSEDTFDFWANTCAFDKQWVTDQAGVFIQSWTCGENGLEQITLEPDDVYEKSIILYVPKQEKSGPVTFRLGFKRMNENGDVIEPVWGDPVTVRVIVPGGGVADGKTVSPTAPVESTAAQAAPAQESPKAESGPSQTYTDPAMPVKVRPGETFKISVTSNPSTGYAWKLDFPKEEKGLMLLDSKHIEASKPMPGAPGNQVYTFKALKTGETKIRLVYQRPWVPSSADTREIFTVIAQDH